MDQRAEKSKGDLSPTHEAEILLTSADMAKAIGTSPRVLLEQMKDVNLFEGNHYVRPFGSRKYLWRRNAVIAAVMQESLEVARAAEPVHRRQLRG